MIKLVLVFSNWILKMSFNQLKMLIKIIIKLIKSGLENFSLLKFQFRFSRIRAYFLRYDWIIRITLSFLLPIYFIFNFMYSFFRKFSLYYTALRRNIFFFCGLSEIQIHFLGGFLIVLLLLSIIWKTLSILPIQVR